MAQDFKTTRTRTITEKTVVEVTADQIEAILIGKFGGKDKKVDFVWNTYQGAVEFIEITVTKESSHSLDDEEPGEPLPVGELSRSVPRIYGTPFEHGTCYVDKDGAHRPHLFVKPGAAIGEARCERCGAEPHNA